MNTVRFFSLVFTSLLFLGCQRELSNVIETVPQPATAAPIVATLQGNVTDENGQPAQGVEIKAGGKSIITDAKGYFRITDANLDKNTSMVTAEKQGYFKGIRSFNATSGVNHVHIQLIPRTLSGTVQATSGGEVSLSGGMKITLPANGIVLASGGNAYDGAVNVYAAYIDPVSNEISRIVPGSFMADDKNGGRVTLSSYGMMAVELETPAGEKLQIKSGSRAKLIAPIPSSLRSSAPQNIAMWYVDQTKGVWKEEGNAVKNGNNYEAEVSHFSFWNCDIAIPAATISMTIKNIDGNPIVHAIVKLVAYSPYPTSAFGFTDSLGQVSGLVPINQPLKLEVLDQCSNVIYSQNIGSLMQNTNIGNVVIPANTTALYTVTGSVVDCSNIPVSEGFIMMNYQNTVRYASVDANGNFSISFIRCDASSANFDILAFNTSSQEQGNIITETLTGSSTSLGNLMACGTSIEQYIDVVIDGIPNQVSWPSDTMRGYTYPDSSGGFTTYLSGELYQGNMEINSIRFNFKHNTESTGVYQMTVFHTKDYPSFTTVVQPSTVNLTSYAATPGAYYQGNFSGKFTWGGSNHTVTGSFRIRRSW